MGKNIATTVTLEVNPEGWTPYVTPACLSCKHAKTRRGVYPIHICDLDNCGRWKDCYCENFTPSKAAEWLAWE